MYMTLIGGDFNFQKFYPVYPYHNDIITLFPSGGRTSSCKGKLYLYLYRTGFKYSFRLTVVGIWKKCYNNVNDRCYVTGFRNIFFYFKYVHKIYLLKIITNFSGSIHI